MFSRDYWILAVGMIVEMALAVWGAVYVVNWIAPADLRDPLARQGGLKSEQK